jgi:hypothetical protein
VAVDHDRIRRMLGGKDESADTSLRAQALDRALAARVPTTLTPHEWEQWYAAHGVPPSHCNAPTKSPPWWRKLLRRKE